MKVILKTDVRGLGKKGEVREAAEGYARNYLIPRGLAEAANDGNMKELAQQKETQARRQAKVEREAEELHSRLEGMRVQVPVRVGQGGRLFGAVTAQVIADALEQAGTTVDRRRIETHGPIRDLGSHAVTVRLHAERQARITVDVVARGDS